MSTGGPFDLLNTILIILNGLNGCLVRLLEKYTLFFSFFAAFSFLFFVLSSINDFFYDENIICLKENDTFDLFTLDYDYSQEDILTELESLGQIIYTHYVLQFLISGLILTLAVVGVVILTIDMTAKNVSTYTKQVSRIPKL